MEVESSAAVFVRRCRVFGDDLVAVEQLVSCPARGRSIAVAECTTCYAHAPANAPGSFGSCHLNVRPALPSRADVAETAARVPVAQIAEDAICVRPDLAVSALTRLLSAERVRAASVVDEDRRLVGFVSKTDISRGDAAGGLPVEASVADIMTPVVHGLPEDAPLAYAISLMAFDSLHEVPIVDGSGRVTGMVTALGVLRWIARTMGYVEMREPL